MTEIGWAMFVIVAVALAALVGFMAYDANHETRKVRLWRNGYLIGGQIVATLVAVWFATMLAVTGCLLPIANWLARVVGDALAGALLTVALLVIMEGAVWSAFMALSLMMASLRRGCLIRKLSKV